MTTATTVATENAARFAKVEIRMSYLPAVQHLAKRRASASPVGPAPFAVGTNLSGLLCQPGTIGQFHINSCKHHRTIGAVQAGD
jgi:hypothetical protein